MNCWTDCCGVFSQGPIKELCCLPAAYCKCECVLGLTADAEAWSSFPSPVTIVSSFKQAHKVLCSNESRNPQCPKFRRRICKCTHSTRGNSNKHTCSRFNGETISQTVFHSDMKVKQKWHDTIRGGLTPLRYWLPCQQNSAKCSLFYWLLMCGRACNQWPHTSARHVRVCAQCAVVLE